MTTDRPTPRTNAARLSAEERRLIASGIGVISEMVPAKFARQLERELAEAREELARLKAPWWASDKKLLDRAERAESALAECRAKLEVDPRTKYDGIDCRDETIRMLEERLADAERKCERLIDVALHKFGVDLSAEFKEDKP